MKNLTLLSFSLVFALLMSCGNAAEKGNPTKSGAASTSSGLSSFELEHGIGPVTQVVNLGESTPAQIEQGKTLFVSKCSACHKTNERYIGPALAGIAEHRSATYVMNMILNPDGMVKKHPEAKKLLAEFLSPMPNQNLSKDEAESVVRYLFALEK